MFIRTARLSRTVLAILTAFLLNHHAAHSEGHQSQQLPRGDWVDHGFAANDRDALVKHLDASVARGELPGGAILLMHEGEVILRKGFGYGHLRKETPFKAGSHFRAASLTKPIIATLAVKLDCEGVIDLDKSIDHVLPSAKRLKLKTGESPKTIPTVRQCLRHTAGFRTDYDSDSVRPWLTLKHTGRTLADVVEKEMDMPMTRDPGTKYSYSGIGYDVVGRVIEVSTGKPIEDVLQETLCKPLGMTHTSFYPSQKIQKGLPSFYWLHRSDGKMRRRWNTPIIKSYEYSAIGGGIITTIDDLAKFMMMHQSGGKVGQSRWIEKSALTAMYEGKSPVSFYGLGFRVGPKQKNLDDVWILHTGSTGTLFWSDPKRDVIGVIATQHKISRGPKIPKSKRVIPRGIDSWPLRTKDQFIDPVFGWTALESKVSRK